MPNCYKVISLDVWGHGPDDCEKYDCKGGDACEGYTVNAAYHTGRTVEVPDAPDGQPWHDALINALVAAGELSESAYEKGAIHVDGESEYTLFINDGKDQKPIIQLENQQPDE